MKKRVYIAVTCTACCLLAGCATNNDKMKQEEVKQEEVKIEAEKVETVVPEDVVVQLKSLGTQTENAVELMMKNSTGAQVTNFWVKPSDAEEWKEDMIQEADKIEKEEVFQVYYAPAAQENSSDISVGFEDGTYIVMADINLKEINFADGNIIELFHDEVPYVAYKKLGSDEIVNTKETVIAQIAKEQEEAQAALAKAQAEEAARAEEEAQSKAAAEKKEKEQRQAAEREAEAEEQAREERAAAKAAAQAEERAAAKAAAQEAAQAEADAQQEDSASGGITEECGHFYDAAGNEVPSPY